jgi:hypothetical protein
MAGMASESRHLAVSIDRTAAEVYAYASNPANIPEWAPGLGSAVEQVDGTWFVQTPGGRVRLDYAAPNEHFVLDHDVTLPTGETVHNPFRVLPDGEASEVVFSLRRAPGMTDDDFDADAEAVLADLRRLKQIVER